MKHKPSSGFTVVELLVALAITSVIAAGIIQLMRSQARTSGDQTLISQTLRDSQRARVLLRSDIAKAGFDPRANDSNCETVRNPCERFALFTNASNDRLILQGDFNMNGAIADVEGGDAETIDYWYVAESREVTRNGNPFLRDVDNFVFTYIDKDSNEITPPGSDSAAIATIKRVKISWSQPVSGSKVDEQEVLINLKNYVGVSE